MRLQSNVCVVTGGASGIGEAVCRLFASEGAVTIAADRNADKAESVAAAVRGEGGEAKAVYVDVSQTTSVRDMVAQVVASYGRVDVLVNNAGYGIPGTVVDTAEEEWERIIRVNLNGVYLGCRHVIPIMREQGGGVIVNTASAVVTKGISNRAAYCATKGGVAALTRAMAIDHAHEGIRVNCVAPGTVDSPYFTAMEEQSDAPLSLRKELEARQILRRLGVPAEVAYAFLYLASPESSFVTGSMLTVDGGMSAW